MLKLHSNLPYIIIVHILLCIFQIFFLFVFKSIDFTFSLQFFTFKTCKIDTKLKMREKGA